MTKLVIKAKKNKEAAITFIDAIQRIVTKPDNLWELECYLYGHFDSWLERFASTPEGLADEMMSFATADERQKSTEDKRHEAL